MNPGQQDGAFPGMIARSGRILLIGRIVLLVHNNQPQPAEGQEEGAAGTQYHTGSSCSQGLGHALAFAGGKGAVIDQQGRNRLADKCFQLAGNANLRGQIQHASPLFQAIHGQFQAGRAGK